MKVDLQKLSDAFQYIRQINRADSDELEWVINGNAVDVSDKAKKEFSFIGFNNTDFAKMFIFNEDLVVVNMKVDTNDPNARP